VLSRMFISVIFTLNTIIIIIIINLGLLHKFSTYRRCACQILLILILDYIIQLTPSTPFCPNKLNAPRPIVYGPAHRCNDYFYTFRCKKSQNSKIWTYEVLHAHRRYKNSNNSLVRYQFFLHYIINNSNLFYG